MMKENSTQRRNSMCMTSRCLEINLCRGTKTKKKIFKFIIYISLICQRFKKVLKIMYL